MATWDDVARCARALPEVTEDQRGWAVRGKGFAWERPLRKGDLEALGDAAPSGPILCARVAHEGEKAALIAEDPTVFFTTPHFNGYPAILVQLEHIDVETLEELITDAWLAKAPKRLAKQFLDGRG